MFFNKKKKKELELSQLPELPESPKFSSEMPKFSYSDGDLKPIPNLPEREMRKEIKDEIHIPQKPSGEKKVSRIREISEAEPKPKKISYEKETDVYVRLDKFEQALKSFNEVKAKLNEMESLLSEVKNVKMKEDAELAKWESEISQVKASLESIDKKIFSKV